jgi:methylisocitrate lyase
MLHDTTPAADKRAAFRAGLASGKTLENLGVNVVIYPVTLLRLAMNAADAGLAAIAAVGTQEGLIGQMQHRRDLYDLLDYESYSTFDTSIYNFRI